MPDDADVAESVEEAIIESEGETVDVSALGCAVGSTLPST